MLPEDELKRWHPRGHSFASRACFRWAGGPAGHIESWYRFGFQYRPGDVLYRLIGCAWGRHKLLDGAGIELYCKHCDYTEDIE